MTAMGFERQMFMALYYVLWDVCRICLCISRNTRVFMDYVTVQYSRID
jgi:hypothetical protein